MKQAFTLAQLEAELEHLVADYNDSDKQDAELRRAIKAQRKLIRERKGAAR